MEAYERLKEIRKELGLTQTEMAEGLGVTRSAIASIEIGTRSLTEQMTRAICLKYKINYFWLRDGIGEMFEQVPAGLLDQLAEQYNLTELDKRIISVYLLLPDEKKTVFREFVTTVFKNQD